MSRTELIQYLIFFCLW